MTQEGLPVLLGYPESPKLNPAQPGDLTQSTSWYSINVRAEDHPVHTDSPGLVDTQLQSPHRFVLLLGLEKGAWQESRMLRRVEGSGCVRADPDILLEKV